MKGPGTTFGRLSPYQPRPGPVDFWMQSLAPLEYALDSLDVLPAGSLPPDLTIVSQLTHHDPKAVIIVAGVRRVVVAVGGATVITIVVPRAAAQPEWRTPISPPAGERRNIDQMCKNF